MEQDDAIEIVEDLEPYEIKAIEAYLRGELKAKALQASLEISRSHMFRLIQRYRQNGAEGLASRKIGVRNNAYGAETRAAILAIVHEKYSDFGPTLAAEKLRELHGIELAVGTLRAWMKAEGLWVDRAGRKPRIYSPRPPRPRRGELVQVDGSYHRWFEKRGPEACLLVFIDDATSDIQLLRLVDHESSYNYMSCLKTYIEQFGCPLALFSDRHSIFRATTPDAAGSRNPTQFAQACARLEIQIICAKTPQAKGRVERANRTLQDRLVKELRLRNISTVDDANRFLEEYRHDHNKRFARPPADSEDAHRPQPNESLYNLLTYAVQRKVFRDLSLSFNKTRIILEDSPQSRRAIGKRVTVALSLRGDMEVLFEETPLPYRSFDKIRRVSDEPEVVDHKRLGAALRMAGAICDTEPHHYKRNAHVMAGFRKQFENPGDPRSKELANAPKEVRRKYRGRPRAPLGMHPIVILDTRLK